MGISTLAFDLRTKFFQLFHPPTGQHHRRTRTRQHARKLFSQST